MSAITKFFVAALAAGAVSALPQNLQANSMPASSSVSSPPVATSSPPSNDGLIAELKESSTAVKRFKKLLVGDDGKILGKDDLAKNVIHNFNGSKPVGNGGTLSAANIDNFPILTDLGISMTYGFLGACGMNTPHTHPRATEFLTLIEGDKLDFGFILENNLVDAGKGSPEVTGTLGKFEGTVFPVGSIHYQVNPTCNDAIFVAALNSEDPGTSQIAQNFFGLSAGVVNATLGFPSQIDGKNIEQFRSQIPPNVARGIDECLKTCNLPLKEDKKDDKKDM